MNKKNTLLYDNHNLKKERKKLWIMNTGENLCHPLLNEHHRTVCVPPLLSYPKKFVVTIQKKERKRHTDNEYRGKAYVIHFLTSKSSLHTSVIKLGYP